MTFLTLFVGFGEALWVAAREISDAFVVDSVVLRLPVHPQKAMSYNSVVVLTHLC